MLAVRRHQLVRQGGLEDRQRLAELHRAALELAQGAEQLLGRALLDLGGTASAGLPPSRLPNPSAVRPAYPSGSAASRAVRTAALRGSSVTRSVSTIAG